MSLLHLWLLLIWWLYFDWFVAGVLFALLSFWWSLRQLAWMTTERTIRAVFVEPRGEVSLRLGLDNTLFKAKMLDCSVACRFVLILHFSIDQKKQSVMIMPDSVSPESFRQLMVYTRWCGFELDN